MVKNNKGFTFVDVICAMAILALVALPICSGFLTAAKTNQRLQEKTEIMTILNNELTKITSSGKIDGLSIDTIFVPNTETNYNKTLSSGMLVTIKIRAVAAIGDAENPAYVEVDVCYDNGTTDTSDDYSVSGVWAG